MAYFCTLHPNSMEIKTYNSPQTVSVTFYFYQVCVEECPNKAMMISENKDEMVEKFCFSSSEYEILPFRRSSDDWTDLDANDLVQKEICPAWVLPSEPFLGRCMPSTSILHNTEGEGMLIHRKYNLD